MTGSRADVPVGSVLGTSHGLCICSAFLNTVKQNYFSKISDRKNGFSSLVWVIACTLRGLSSLWAGSDPSTQGRFYQLKQELRWD